MVLHAVNWICVQLIGLNAVYLLIIVRGTFKGICTGKFDKLEVIISGVY